MYKAPVWKLLADSLVSPSSHRERMLLYALTFGIMQSHLICMLLTEGLPRSSSDQYPIDGTLEALQRVHSNLPSVFVHRRRQTGRFIVRSQRGAH
jgi:hypothetical protein